MDLSIVIPMFNEAENVENTLKKVEGVLSQFQGTFEIIPVNDGSVDNTLEELKKVAERNNKVKVVSYPNNIGRGMALRKGFRESSGEIIVSIDADLSYSPHYILDFVETLRKEPEIDFVLASPYMPGRRCPKCTISSPVDQQIREQDFKICNAEPDLYVYGNLPRLPEKGS